MGPIPRLASRRSALLWGAVCFLLLPVPALAQLQTSVSPALPSLSQEEKGPDDPDATFCRPPERQTDSRLYGPKVCMTNRQWDKLHAEGLDISADGKTTVASEKYRTLHSGNCRTRLENCN